MNTPVVAGIISAAAAVFALSLSFYLTKRNFASACNTVHLIASKGVLDALHGYQNEISVSNANRDDATHDRLLSRLEWEIREDLRIPDNPPVEEFTAHLWCSGNQR